MIELDGWPAFARELDATLAVHTQFMLWGNLRDCYLCPSDADGNARPLLLRELLWRLLHRSGYEFMLINDQIDGPRVYPDLGDDAAAATAAAEKLLGKHDQGIPSLERIRTTMSTMVRPPYPIRAAFVFDYASRLVLRPTELTPGERDFFTFCEKLSRTADPVHIEHQRSTALHNPVIWLVNSEGDLPIWFTADNPMIRVISVPEPDLGQRLEAARLLARSFRIADDQVDGAEACAAFAAQAEGLTLQEMIDVTRLARDRGLGFDELPDAVRMYKLGVLDNPWKRKYLRRQIVDGEQQVAARVLGQPQAVTKTLDILKRAVLGLSGAQAATATNRPRGVLFFAGPTGVGKTELAKAIAALIFGDETAYLRFDMSEFSAEHAGDRLIGAPPGYIGFEQGGELTNAVRQQPFRVILFDEIEKAHPRILDKFLQILEDGRLTDGRGNTAHFSESIIVFTSNLGMFVTDATGTSVPSVTPGTPYNEMERQIKQAITDYFTRVLNRPELLNRLGDNIVVFDYISPEVAGQIFDLLLSNIVKRVANEQDVTLLISDEVTATLRTWCTADLDKGGRGIGMALESYFVNPLARALFDAELIQGSQVQVCRIQRDGNITSLELA